MLGVNWPAPPSLYDYRRATFHPRTRLSQGNWWRVLTQLTCIRALTKKKKKKNYFNHSFYKKHTITMLLYYSKFLTIEL